jgi:hypothetical protein
MPKFIIRRIDRYEVEAKTLQEAQARWQNEILVGETIGEDRYVEYIDSSTTYEEKGEN